MESSNKFKFNFYKWEKKLKDKPFLRQPFGDKWEEYTWGETGQMARKLAAGLKTLGLPPKSHIGLMSKNCREWIIADLAIYMAGYISVPFFPTLNSKELQSLLHFGDVSALFMGKVNTWDEIKNGIPDDMPLIAFPHYKGCSEISVGHQWFDFINKFEPQQEDFYPNRNDIWTIIFTSGTTGTPKGVVLDFQTNENTECLTTPEHNPLRVDFNGKNTFFSYLPLNHIAERVVVEWTCFRYGGTISFTESLETFAQNLGSVQPTIFFGVPRIYTKFQMGILSKFPQKKLNKLLSIPIISSLLKMVLKKKLGLSKAKAIVSGAAPMQESQRVWYRNLGVNITNGYGMTENCAICTQLPGEITDKPGSVGKPQPEVDIKIDSETGEILMRGPYVMKGYYNDPETTNNTIKNGWLYTGDRGRIDDEGNLYITGRVKDTFKTNTGEFVEPGKIEALFGDVTEFEQMCLVGYGIAAPILLAVPSEGANSIDKNTLKQQLSNKLELVNKNLVSYRKVSTIVIMKEAWSPENGLCTPTLKIKRVKIDEKFMSKYSQWHENSEAIIWE
ncbi:MAG: AMP-dependent synthetase [Flavobacteriales bacterium]|nr:MAG: AMP-dependent synthetase [Flavobacteriales bacterium]|tara:strand:- start:288 stop:1964 length:1677 start_codon:yes stop_codon:yes gene_type:complete